MHCLLLGNGINRLSRELEWPALLSQLARDLGVDGFAKQFDDKPLSFLFEELCAYKRGQIRDTERTIKKRIANLLKKPKPHALHRQVGNLFSVILTTNYEDTLENALVGPLTEPSPVMPESRYSGLLPVRLTPPLTRDRQFLIVDRT